MIQKLWVYFYNIFPSFGAYVAWCDNVDVDSKLEYSKLESEERTISAEYPSKLVNENYLGLDPVSLKDGRLKIETTKKRVFILQWPSTDYLDIVIGLTQPDFLKRLQSDYKQDECNRYFTCEFILEDLQTQLLQTQVY